MFNAKKVIDITADDFDDVFTCECGNCPDYGGFLPINENGDNVEDFTEEWKDLWICGNRKCQIIYKIIDWDKY